MRETLEQGGVVVAIVGLMAAVALGIAAVGYPAAAAEVTDSGEEVVATAIFEGEEIPADEVWEVAEACVVESDGVMKCYRSTEDRDEAESSTASGDGGVGTLSSCPVRLYSSTFYGGTELTLNTRFMWHNLGNYGFSNRTSSYKISGCSSTFRDGANGSGSTYSGSTGSWTWCSSMANGWNNKVSSVWIH